MSSAGQAVPVSEPRRDLELGAHRRQRAAQLVRRVGDEGPLRAPGRRHAVEHLVERRRQRRDLVAGRRYRQPLVRRRPVDPRGAAAQFLDRGQRRADDPPGDHRAHDE
jgi:hypothetical protein